MAIDGRTHLAVIFTALLLIAGQAQADAGYKCVAADGSIEYRELIAKDMECTPLRPTPPSSTDPEAELEKLRQQVETVAPADSNQPLSEAEQQQQNCERAQRNLAILESDTDVVRTDADGNKVVLADEQRAAALEQTRKDVEYWCN